MSYRTLDLWLKLLKRANDRCPETYVWLLGKFLVRLEIALEELQ